MNKCMHSTVHSQGLCTVLLYRLHKKESAYTVCIIQYSIYMVNILIPVTLANLIEGFLDFLDLDALQLLELAVADAVAVEEDAVGQSVVGRLERTQALWEKMISVQVHVDYV